jgi:glucose-6-phosphate isomerase
VKIDSLEFGLKNQSAIKIINHQADATFQALLTQKVPSAMLNLNNYSASSIAQLIAFIQSAIYYFCLLLDVNWENNPSVNMGKQICNTAIRTSLSKKQRKIERKETAAKQFSDNMT